jgi:hypothetical protein
MSKTLFFTSYLCASQKGQKGFYLLGDEALGIIGVVTMNIEGRFFAC